MTPTYTKQEILQLVTERLRLWNYGNPEAKIMPGLTLKDTEIIGLVSSALPEGKRIDFDSLYEDQPLGIGA